MLLLRWGGFYRGWFFLPLKNIFKARLRKLDALGGGNPSVIDKSCSHGRPHINKKTLKHIRDIFLNLIF